ncbi:MAG: aminotransferase class I/II-fold pyridoxal phosphate-dependent enzyme [Chloroflexi bacterium]|nr:aminotransferase class I/II-fold pyridoxal phosphate-dependent enzyme [Chloroflexota bacterium]
MTAQGVQVVPLTIAQLRARRSKKWLEYGSRVLPAWVADMDFEPPEQVRRAVELYVAQRDFGYPTRDGIAPDRMVAHAFARRVRARWDWEVEPAQVVGLTDMIQGLFAAVVGLSEPGDEIVLQTPTYPPLRLAISMSGRTVVENPMRDDGTAFIFDADHLRAVDPRVRLLMLCNPHNPTGRVLTRTELEAIAEWACERDAVVVSDEVHADLVYDGWRHIPIATLGPEIAARTVTLFSASKAFNIAGLKCAVMHFGSEALQARFHTRIPAYLLGHLGAIGADATLAAWGSETDPWLEALLSQLQASRDHLAAVLARELPGVRYYQPEGTYLAWLDCTALGLEPSPFEHFLKKADVALNDGVTFGDSFASFVRLNFGTSREILDAVLERMIRSVR